MIKTRRNISTTATTDPKTPQKVSDELLEPERESIIEETPNPTSEVPTITIRSPRLKEPKKSTRA